MRGRELSDGHKWLKPLLELGFENISIKSNTDAETITQSAFRPLYS